MRDVPREAAAQAADAKHDVGEEQALLPAEDVTELAVQGLAAREGEEVPVPVPMLSVSQPGFHVQVVSINQITKTGQE